MSGKTKDDEFDEKEAQARFEAALKGGLNTPHKPLKAEETGGQQANLPSSFTSKGR
jgi:hypothetical protein